MKKRPITSEELELARSILMAGTPPDVPVEEASVRHGAELIRDFRVPPDAYSGLRVELERLINANSAENGSNTPDFVIAGYLTDCLAAFDRAVKARMKWYGKQSESVPGTSPEAQPDETQRFDPRAENAPRPAPAEQPHQKLRGAPFIEGPPLFIGLETTNLAEFESPCCHVPLSIEDPCRLSCGKCGKAVYPDEAIRIAPPKAGGTSSCTTIRNSRASKRSRPRSGNSSKPPSSASHD